ncbi:hypothetical protein Ahy_B02g061497 [Arachis hypogaea]|uniref:Uncharacterized protein n=1 Tax=Arachis hypogaea TaxID=3818 RepID=A0A445AL37_ARAHY|nr:hypothetical protein Ahy_B02g061497 [Arachis hypogaea]
MHIKSSYGEPLLELRSRKIDNLVIRSHNICEFALESEELTAILQCAYDNVMTEMQEHKVKSKEKYLLSHENASLDQINDLQSPPLVRIRGRPKNRMRSNTENQIANASKKKKKKKKAVSEIKLMCFD